jgi:hypothetical protein
MTVYTYSKAKQNFTSLLDEALKEGEVQIKRKDGQIFILRPGKKQESPLDVEGVDIDLTAEEIVQFIHEGRPQQS